MTAYERAKLKQALAQIDAMAPLWAQQNAHARQLNRLLAQYSGDHSYRAAISAERRFLSTCFTQPYMVPAPTDTNEDTNTDTSTNKDTNTN